MSLPDWMQAQLSRGKVVIQPSELYMPSGATLSGLQITLQSGLTAPVISGVVGEFTSSLTVQGKVVIKDGDPVAVASGEVHIISGVIQVTSGTTLPVSIVSGFVASLSGLSVSANPNISGGVTVSGGVQISGTIGVSGQVIVTSGGIIPVAILSGAMNVSGGVTVSGGVQVSGTVAVSGQVIVTSGGTLPVAVLSGAMNISGGVTISGAVSVSGTVAVSGQVLITSGGTIPVSVVSGISTESGAYYNIAASGVGISHYSGALNINISGGTISTTPPAYQSGTLVGISGGNLAMSGLIVYDSGAYFSLAASGVGISHYSGALNINISGGTISTTPVAYQSGTLVGISGGSVGLSGLIGVSISGSVTVLGHTISGGVSVSGFVGALSGGTIPVGVISGAMNISGGVTVSGGISVSGTVGVSGIIQNLQSGTINIFQRPTYHLTSYWSGAVAKRLIALTHAGGAAGQSGLEAALESLAVGIYSSGLINRIDIIIGSGILSGTAGSPITRFSSGGNSAVSGWIDGATAISSGLGNVRTVDTLFLESNSSGIMHTYKYVWGQNDTMNPRIASGQNVFVALQSGIGIGYIKLEWTERYP